MFSLDAATVLDDLSVQVPVLPTPDFAGPPERVDADRFDELMVDQMTYAGDWELLATALEDADRGDASALAALVAGASGAADGDDRNEPGDSIQIGADLTQPVGNYHTPNHFSGIIENLTFKYPTGT